jgi:hypothetical protein
MTPRDPRAAYRACTTGCLIWLLLTGMAVAIGLWTGWFYGLVFILACVWTAMVIDRRK